MSYREYAPPAALEPWVEVFWRSTSGTDPTGSRILPDGCMDWIFTERSERQARTHALEVIGTMTTWQSASRVGSPERVGVRFRPGAAAPLLDCEASELTDGATALCELWTDAESLLEALATARPDRRVGVMAGALQRRIARHGLG